MRMRATKPFCVKDSRFDCLRYCKTAAWLTAALSFLLLLIRPGQAQDLAHSSSRTAMATRERPQLPDHLSDEIAHLEKTVKDALRQPENLKLLTEAIPIAERALSIRQTHQGKAWWETVDAQHRLFDLHLLSGLGAEQRAKLAQADAFERQVKQLYNEGKYSEGIGPALEACEIRRHILGEKHHYYTASLNNLALLYSHLGRYEEAEQLYNKALEIDKQAGGEEHPEFATDLNNLAELHIDRGQYRQAEPLLRRALEIQKNAAGKEDEGYAAGLNNLAEFYRTTGRYPEAEPLLLQCLTILKKKGGGDPRYATVLNNLGALYEKVGRYEEAETRYLRSLEITKEKWGEEHPDYAIALNNLALLYRDMGQYPKAVPLLLQASRINEKFFGKEHPVHATDLNNLAAVFSEMGRSTEAESLFLESNEIVRKRLGETHPFYATSLSNLADFYVTLGRYEQSEPLFRQALEIEKTALGPDHPNYAIHLSNLSRLYYLMGRWDQTESLLLQALKIESRTLGEEHPAFANNLGNLAVLYIDLDRREEAERLFLKELEIKKRTLGPEHPSYAIDLANLAGLYFTMGRYEQAEPLLLHALEVEKRTLGDEHPVYLFALNNLAGLYTEMGRYEDAELRYRSALEITKKVLGEQHPAYTKYLYGLAIALVSSGQEEEASRLLLASAHAEFKRFIVNFPAMSDPQKQQFLIASGPRQSPMLWSLVFAGHSTAETGLDVALLSKQLLFEAARQESAVLGEVLASASPEWQASWHERELLHSEYAALELQNLSESGRPQLPGHKPVDLRRLRSLYTRIEELEQQLRQTNSAYAKQARLKEITLNDVRRALHANEALVEYVQYRRYDTENKKWATLHYGAFVLRGDNGEVAAVDLGEAEGVNGIDPAVQRLRRDLDEFTVAWNAKNAVGGATPSAKQLALQESENSNTPGVLSERRTALALADLRSAAWDPIEKHLSGVKRVYIAPDGQLSLIPFEALARRNRNGGWRYLAEDWEFVYVGTGRDLGRLSLTAATQATQPSAKTAVLVGNPAFDALPNEVAREVAGLDSRVQQATSLQPNPATDVTDSDLELGDSTGGALSSMQIPRNWQQMPVLAQFVKHTGEQLSRYGWSVNMLQDLRATEEAVKKLPAPRILQFATHGYLMTSPARNLPTWDNPLLHSMLMLAGVNSWHANQSVFYRVGRELLPKPEAQRRGLSQEQLQQSRVQVDDGILTAYEVTGMNLRGTELVNLTACDTGLGDVTPDGVAGLRQGFLLAGARSLTMSLWKIPAQEATNQIEDFYYRWLTGKTGTKSPVKYEAFREAQLAALDQARAKYRKGYPFYWAGIVFVGDPGDLPGSSPNTTAASEPSQKP